MVKSAVGLVLLLVGAALAAFLFLNVSRTDTVIDISFMLAPGEKYGPYENGTYHHARLAKSSLRGEMIVQGGEIIFSAEGSNTQHLKNIPLNQNSSFTIDPADDLYTFTFDNSASSAATVRFILKETWRDTLSLLAAFAILLATIPVAVVLVIMGLREGSLKDS